MQPNQPPKAPPIYLSQPVSSTLQASHVDPVLLSHSEGIGQIQQHLAGIIDPQIADRAAAVNSIKMSVGKVAGKAHRFQQKNVDALVQHLGTLGGAAIQQRADAVQTIGSAAATGGLQQPALAPIFPEQPTGPQVALTEGLPGLQPITAPAPLRSGVALTEGIEPTTLATPATTNGQQLPPTVVDDSTRIFKAIENLPPPPQQTLQDELLQAFAPVPQCNRLQYRDIAQQTTYCDQLKVTAKNLVDIGRNVLAQIGGDNPSLAIAGTSLWKLASWALPTHTDLDSITTQLDSYFNSGDAYAVLLNWNCLVNWLEDCYADDVRAVLAVKAVLSMWEGTKLSISFSGSNAGSGGLSLRPQALGIGAGVSYNKTETDSLAYSISIAVALVPALELVDQVIHYLCPRGIPSIGDAITMFLAARIDYDTVRCLIAANGGRWDMYKQLITADRTRLNEDQILDWQYRNGLPDQFAIDLFRGRGWLDDSESLQRRQLHWQMESTFDAVRFATFQLQSNTLGTQYGLYDRFDTDFYTPFGPALRSHGIAEKYARELWATHWQLPGTATLAEFVYRLNPQIAPADVAFDLSDYTNFLVLAGYPDYIVKRMESIVYSPISVRKISQLYDNGVIPKADLARRFMLMGYSPVNAQELSANEVIQSEWRNASRKKGFTPALIAELVEYGIFDRDKAERYLVPLGLTPADIDSLVAAAVNRKALAKAKKHEDNAIDAYARLALKAYQDGTVDKGSAMSAMMQAGYSQAAATLALNTTELQVRMDTVQAAVTVVRKGYFLGAVNAQEASNALVVAGVVPGMANVYLNRWQLEKSTARIAASAALIKAWVRKGIISIANAVIRFRNLGWNQADIDLTVLELRQSVQQLQATIASRNAKQMAAAQRAAQTALTRSQKGMCSVYTTGKLTRWYAQGIIDDSEFIRRNKLCGRTDEAIADLLKEAQIARDKVTSRPSSSSPAPKSKQPKQLAAATLKRLFVEGIIDDSGFRTAVRNLGYTDSEVSELFRDAELARQAKNAKATVAGTGSGSNA